MRFPSISSPALPTILALSIASSVFASGSTDVDPPPGTQEVGIDGRSLGGFVLPILPIQHDLEISTTRATRWLVDDTQRLLLQNNVEIELGTYTFRSEAAVIWINRLPSADGLRTQIAAWFPSVAEPNRRAGLGASGRDVLVTATIDGEVKLRTVVMAEGPVRSTVVADGEARLSRYLRRLASPPLPKLSRQIGVKIPPIPEKPVLEPGGSIRRSVPRKESSQVSSILLPDSSDGSLPIFDPRGLVSFNADEIVVDEKRDAIIIVGSVVIDYDGTNTTEDLRRLSMVAERGVVFLQSGTIQGLRSGTGVVEAGLIEGIYLEGAVRASDGSYTLRGSSIYYDLPNNQAAVMDAVLRTYTRKGRRLPVYARAEELRQVADDQWEAKRATVSTSEFFTPHLSIGLDRVTITERDDPAGGSTTWVKGNGLTMEALGVPFFYWPSFEGEADSPPLKEVRSGYERFKGFGISTEWDLFKLLGLAAPPGVNAELLIDGWLERGPAAGLVLDLSSIGGVSGGGRLDAYGLYDFGGTDRTSAGVDVSIEEEMRGQVVGEYRAALSADLYLEAQLSYLSDETWAAAWRQREYESRREYESSLYLNYSPDNTSLSVLARTQLNDFMSNGWAIASQPYFVEKLPEINYDREGDDIADVVTWSSTWNFASMRISPTAGTSNSLGVRPETFGIKDGDIPVKDLYAAAGYEDDSVQRFYTRQEFAVPFSGEGWAAAPFVFGRFNGYLDGNDEAYRRQQSLNPDLGDYGVMLGGGVRASTQFQSVDNSARNRTFDIHRLRHILEPYTTLWYGWDSQPDGAFPLYEQRVEGATGGTAAQFGVRQTVQTQRGGPGNRESVDMLVLNYGAVFNDGTDDFQRNELVGPNGTPNLYAWTQSPYPSFERWEPELSQWGSHAYGSALWRVSSSLNLAANGLFNWETREVYDYSESVPTTRRMSGLLRGSTGVELIHDPDTTSYVEYRYLAASDNELLQAGLTYRIGRIYQLGLGPQYDLRRGEFRSASATLRRTLPDFDFLITVGYDLIQDETSFGVKLSVPPQPGVGFPTY